MRRERPTDPLTGEVRFTVPLPVLIPLGAVAFIALATIGFSRVLLAIPPEAATAIALATSVNVLLACAVVALRPRLSQAAMAELAIVVIYPVLIGVAIAALGIGEAEEEGAAAAAEPKPVPSGPISSGDTLVAADLQFSTDEIRLQAGEDATIEFDNQDEVQHNLAIYEDDSAQQDIFVGEYVTGASITYEFGAPEDPGTYFFRCDAHPTDMTGEVTVQ
jgi:plastocyanin